MDFNFLSQADEATLRLEMAKRAIDLAKAEFEQAKQHYEETLARAEEHGISKAKLKKLTEERVSALFDSGMVNFTFTGAREAKPERPKEKLEGKSKSKAPKKETVAQSSSEVEEQQVEEINF